MSSLQRQGASVPTEGPVPAVLARQETLPAGFAWFGQNEIDPGKVAALRSMIRAGRSLPLPVLARYGDDFLPLDGHHRTAAHSAEGLAMTAWVLDGDAFDDLDCQIDAFGVSGRAEDYVMCGGVPAMKVAA